jgi:hypothetical protein
LIPEHVTETGAPGNDAQSAAYAYTQAQTPGKLSLQLTQAGRFTLKLFSGPGAAGKLLAQSRVLTVEQQAPPALSGHKPPYVTINPAPGKLEVQEGFPVIAYYAVPPDCPGSAWLAVVPLETTSKLESDNLKASISYMYLDGKTQGDFTWVASIPGTYVFRLFPSSDHACYAMSESEPFTVVPRQR